MALHVALRGTLEHDVERRGRQELHTQGGRDGLDVLAGALAPPFTVAVNGVEPQADLLGQKSHLFIDRGATAAEVVPAQVDGAGLAGERGAFGRDVDGAAGIDIAVGKAAGTA